MTGSHVDLQLGEEQVVRVRGCIDCSCSAELSEALSRAVEQGRKVVIDLSGAELLDSSAIESLLAAHQQAQARGVTVALAAVSETVTRILQMSGLASTFGLSLLTLDGKRQAERADLRRQDWQITESAILADPELIAPLRDLAAGAARQAGLDEDSTMDVQLAVTEALASAFRGSSEHGQGKISLRCLACPRAFVVEVTDEWSKTTDQAGRPAQSELGLRLMQQAMDEVEFVRDQRVGRVRMLKWISAI